MNMWKWKVILGVGVFLLGTDLAFAGLDIPQIVHTVFPDAKARVHSEGENLQQYDFIIPASAGQEQLQALTQKLLAKTGWHNPMRMPGIPEDLGVMYMGPKSCMLQVTLVKQDASLPKGKKSLLVSNICGKS
ncbi:hypothetical protein [Acidithiobacillus thiooxidans]|nr:hypothetical protein [Acidithiobacillus thiooxidans]